MSDCRFGVSPVNYPDPDPDDDLPKQTWTISVPEHSAPESNAVLASTIIFFEDTSCFHCHAFSLNRL